MSYKQNLHTHCSYCDGKDTPEEMIAYAIEKGFDSIGFSSHSYTPQSVSGLLTPEKAAAYREKLPELKREFADRLKIWYGIEYEYCCGQSLDGYDYRLGAVHYVPTDDGWKSMDRDVAGVRELIGRYFGGDSLALVKTYYETVAKLPEKGHFDILAHFDLITKNIELAPDLLDADSKAYREYALGAMEAVRGKIPFFEVNAGAIARGRRTTPYPALPLIKAFREMGFLPVITSDCHDKRYLDFYFEESAQLLKVCGFKEKMILTEEGFVPEGL